MTKQRFLSPLSPISAALLSGLLGGVSFAPYPLGIFAFVFFVPLLAALDTAVTTGQVLRRTYWAFFVFHGASCWWISSWQQETDPYLLVAGLALWLAHPFFFAVPLLAYHYVRQRLGKGIALAVLPFFWTAFEWLHSLGDLSFPWQALGYTQIYYLPIAQIAEITGVWGISFFLVSVNAVLYALIFPPLSYNKVRLRWTAAVVGLVGVAIVIFGINRLKYWEEYLATRQDEHFTVGVIQPNINPWQKWSGNAFANVEAHFAIQDTIAEQYPEVELFVWSETVILFRLYSSEGEYVRHIIEERLRKQNVSLLTGFVDEQYYTKKEAPPLSRPLDKGSETFIATYNAATILPAKQGSMKSHRKSRLTPFGEGFPFAEYLEFASEWLRWGVGISGWAKGKTTEPLPLALRSGGEVRIAPVVCIESIYPECVRSFVQNGATLLSVITNDAWYDATPGPEQHYQIAAMRAIENRRFLARAANSGVSGIIRPDGASVASLPNLAKGAVIGKVLPLDETTFYTRNGDLVAYFSTFFAFLVLIFTKLQKRITRTAQ